MKNINEIIASYKADGHKVDGLYIREVQRLTDSEILEIIEEAKGRDIIIDKFGEIDKILDGQRYKFEGEIEKDFDLGKYL